MKIKDENSEFDAILKTKLNSNLKQNVKKILFIQPLQIDEEKVDFKIALNRRYYMYPPYGPGILNAVLKKNGYNSKLLDLNFAAFKFIHEIKKVTPSDISNLWQSKL